MVLVLIFTMLKLSYLLLSFHLIFTYSSSFDIRMFTAIRESLKPSRNSTMSKIRTSAQSFFVPDRIVHFDDTKVGTGTMDEPLTPGPSHLSRNKTERYRLQGLVRSSTNSEKGVGKVRTFGEKVKVWMINDGIFPLGCKEWLLMNRGMSRFFLIFWIILHIIGFGMSIVHYKMKDNLNTARGMFGWSFGRFSLSLLTS
jgi:hypothetical protein